jgi:hypothetical protein
MVSPAAGPSTAGGWRFYGQVVKLLADRKIPFSDDRLKSQQVDAPNVWAVSLGTPSD